MSLLLHSLQQIDRRTSRSPVALEKFARPVIETPAEQPGWNRLASSLDRLESLRAILSPSGTDLPESTAPAAQTSRKPQTEAATQKRPAPSLLREEYRELANHLRARLPSQAHCTLAMVDAGPVASDATWLVHLATGMFRMLGRSAAEQSRVLLVEGAGPACGISRHLGIGVSPGLGDMLRGGTSLSEAVQGTFHPQIDFLTSGANLVEAIEGDRLKHAWVDLKREYDLLLVATGPIALADSPTIDSAADGLLTVADAAVLSVELGSTPLDMAKRTRTSLLDRGIKLIGCVVHGVDRV